ncbi:hypothetical protein [Paenibacillus silvisoli]|uniref:hypothetical protein n=1 Tax=Paenibacillus silvisoli TaxID=3110539 RepID=UPI002804BF53|nr:hypothetical protein [Paenibacillus silvisoli]
MTLLQKLINMQSQLQEHEKDGELHTFIFENHEDLYRLLDQAIRVMGRDEK